MNLTLFHFFPDKLYGNGDRGNVIALRKRCEWRGMELNIVEINDCSNVDLTKADILLIGGASNTIQKHCTEQLSLIKDELKAAIEDGVSALTINGGYQFLGSHYELPNGKKLSGLAIFDFYTTSPTNHPRNRLVGNVVVESEKFGTIVGFENHLGRTFHTYETLGTVITGYGNNDSEKKEGLLYKNLIGTYLHGPILPKNPTLADYLLEGAFKRKTGNELPDIANDHLENLANMKAKELFLKNS